MTKRRASYQLQLSRFSYSLQPNARQRTALNVKLPCYASLKLCIVLLCSLNNFSDCSFSSLKNAYLKKLSIVNLWREIEDFKCWKVFPVWWDQIPLHYLPCWTIIYISIVLVTNPFCFDLFFMKRDFCFILYQVHHPSLCPQISHIP